MVYKYLNINIQSDLKINGKILKGSRKNLNQHFSSYDVYPVTAYFRDGDEEKCEKWCERRHFRTYIP